jgi:hypothetical protein
MAAQWREVERFRVQPGATASLAVETFVGDRMGDARRRQWVWVSTKLGTFHIGDGHQYRIRFGDAERTVLVVEVFSTGGNSCVT